MVEFNNERIPLYKLIIHIVQVVFSLAIWCMEIAVFKYGTVTGQMGWTFGVVSLDPLQIPFGQHHHHYHHHHHHYQLALLTPSPYHQCFLSIPAWVYLIMAPRYPRTRKIAQPNAMLCIDALYTIIWLSAFATQAAYNTANDCGSACGVSKAIVGLGIFET